LEVIVNYALYLISAGLLMTVFFMVYCWATPFDEMAQIRAGNSAAALCFSGALIGFSLTIASAILHSTSLVLFLAWSVGAIVVQLVVYVLVSRLLHMSKEQIESNNVAFGGLLGAISLAVGAINAACLS
jgi:putative membrane protein